MACRLANNATTITPVEGESLDAELEELFEEDSSQTQKELALTLEVTQQAVSHCLKSLGIMHKQVGLVRTVKAFTLAYVSIVFTTPVLVWGAPLEGSAPALADHTLHHVLAFAYSALVFFNVFTGK
ncbi:Mariner Mos1 transposase [Eumeta japonica]|uniref:Mariner Mos1 transposase n=1 Tax=Eumeta variegata TaxID=151549 RepID=A0A4C1UUQ8_EUMVA|nr:Mariner Mos1 transposase [Eumeta japonica]